MCSESRDTGISAYVYLKEMVIQKINSAVELQRQKWKNAVFVYPNTLNNLNLDPYQGFYNNLRKKIFFKKSIYESPAVIEILFLGRYIFLFLSILHWGYR